MNLSQIEQSIIKKYRKPIWSKFTKAVKDYNLIQSNDQIAVCLSGGKDSFLLAKCMQELQKHGPVSFTLKYILINPGFSPQYLKQVKKMAHNLNIPLLIKETNIFKVTAFLNKSKPCYLCARMRRGYLYRYAQELGCHKIALGHHFDDVIETILLALFYSGEFKTMRPKLKSTNFKEMELIRPLYLVKEKDILNWAKSNYLNFKNNPCNWLQFKEDQSKRLEIKKLITQLRQKNPYIDQNIFAAGEHFNSQNKF